MRSFRWRAISFALALVSSQTFAGNLTEHNKAILNLIGKIRAKETEIAELIVKKRTTTDQQEMSEILDKLAKSHKDFVKHHADLDKEEQHKKYEHPEQENAADRQYRAMRVKTLQEFEQEGGIDGRLTELKEKVKKKYGEPQSGQPAPQPSTVPVYKTKLDEQAERDKKRIKLSK
ncbi:MAG: hypothetical protein ABL958_14995 [Bdellovibrionia bacterium]